MKKIDAHLHLANPVAGYCRRGESRAIGGGRAQWGNGEIFQLFPVELGDMTFTAEDALEKCMKPNGVDKAVLMSGSMYGFQNQYHKLLLEKYPDTFCPSCTIDPFMTNYKEAIKRFMEEDGFHLAKFEVSSGGGLMGCHDPFDLAGDEMMYIYKTVEEHRGVVALDVGDIAMASHQPWSIMEIARKCPDLKVVVCHLLAPTRGWEREWKLSLELLNLPNVWFDIAAIPKIMAPDEYPYPVAAEYLQMAKEILTAKKFMWGTDAPFAATQDTYEHLTDYLFKNGAFTEEELEDVYYNNAELVYFSK